MELIDGRVGAKHLRIKLVMENNVRSQMLCPYELRWWGRWWIGRRDGSRPQNVGSEPACTHNSTWCPEWGDIFSEIP